MGIISMNGQTFHVPDGANISMVSNGYGSTIYVNGKVFNPNAAMERKVVKPVFEGDGFKLREDLSMETEDGVVLYRIEATRQRLGGRVKPGDLGGFVVTAENITGGDAWVDETSKVLSPDVSVRSSVAVLENSVLDGDVLLFGNAEVRNSTVENGRIGDHAVILNSTLNGSLEVLDSAQVAGSVVEGTGYVRGNALLERSTVPGTVQLDASARVSSSSVSGTLTMNGKSAVEDSKISGMVTLTHNAKMDRSKASGMVDVSGSGLIEDSKVSGMLNVSGTGRVVGEKISGMRTVTS